MSATAATILVDGQWQPALGGTCYERRNPADVDEIVGEYAAADERDVDRAVAAVRRAQPAWEAVGAMRRGRVLADAATELRAAADPIAAQLTAEEGKPLPEARGEVLRAADVFDYFAHEAARADGRCFASSRPGAYVQTTRKALGVVAAITPFNFPAFVPAMKLAPALLAGNGVVWKPAPTTPGTGIHVMNALLRAGLPESVVGYLTGPSPEVGAALVAHADVAAISFTGSTAVGLAIEQAAARRHARVQLEMGGKNPLVVLADCDLMRAVDAAADSAFGGSGQKCTAAGRILVDAPVHDEFVAQLVARANSLRVGHGRDAGVQVGPLISDAARQHVRATVKAAVAGGAQIRTNWPDDAWWTSQRGHFFPPTVMTGVRPSMTLFDEETFGPVAAVTRINGFAEILALSNHGRYALSAAIHTSSLAAAY